MAQFKDLLTLPALHTFVKDEGFKYPTKVQAASIPRLLSGKSLSVLAQTGSGKTLAYALPIVELLKQREDDLEQDESPVRSPVAWVLCPTIELGAQVEQVFKSIAHRAKLRVRHAKQGKTQKQKRASLAGAIDVIVGSPSQLRGALESGELKADAASFVILDEADLLFEHDFLPDVQAVMKFLHSPGLQVGLFSATMPANFGLIRKESFAGIAFDNVELQGRHALRDNITTNNHTVPFKDKLEHTVAMLKQLKGPGFLFVNLKRTAEEVFEYLSETLPTKRIHLLHGGVEKRERRTAIAKFLEAGDVLVCTDIVARGIDLREMKWVLNYDLPFEPVYYIHRCGRVGRGGEPAHVFNLVTTKDFPLIERINEAIASQGSLKLSLIPGQKGAGKGKSRKARPQSTGKPGRGKKSPSRQTRGKGPNKPGRGKQPNQRSTTEPSPTGRRGRNQSPSGRSPGSAAPSGKSSRGHATKGNAPTGRRGRGQAPSGRPVRGKSGGRPASGSTRGKRR